MPSGAYSAGTAFRERLAAPDVQQSMALAKRQATNMVFPGASLIRPGAAAVGDFLQGLLGAPGAAAAASPARAAAQAAPATSLSRGGQSPVPDLQQKRSNPSFADLAAMAAQANGGKLSFRQLAALSDVAYKTSPRETVRTPTYKDIVGGELLSRSQQLLEAEQAQAQAMIAAGDEKGGVEYGKAAVSRYLGNLQQIMGADPLEQAYAAQIAAQEE